MKNDRKQDNPFKYNQNNNRENSVKNEGNSFENLDPNTLEPHIFKQKIDEIFENPHKNIIENLSKTNSNQYNTYHSHKEISKNNKNKEIYQKEPISLQHFTDDDFKGYSKIDLMQKIVELKEEETLKPKPENDNPIIISKLKPNQFGYNSMKEISPKTKDFYLIPSSLQNITSSKNTHPNILLQKAPKNMISPTNDDSLQNLLFSEEKIQDENLKETLMENEAENPKEKNDDKIPPIFETSNLKKYNYDSYNEISKNLYEKNHLYKNNNSLQNLNIPNKMISESAKKPNFLTENKKIQDNDNYSTKNEQRSLPKNAKIKSYYNLDKYKSYLNEMTYKNPSLQQIQEKSKDDPNKVDYKTKFTQLKNDLEALSSKINQSPNKEKNNSQQQNTNQNFEKEEEENKSLEIDFHKVVVPSLEKFDRVEKVESSVKSENSNPEDKTHQKVKTRTEKNINSVSASNKTQDDNNGKYLMKDLSMESEPLNLNKKSKNSEFRKTFSLREQSKDQNNPKNLDSKLKKEDINEFEKQKQENEKLIFVHNTIEIILNQIDYEKINLEKQAHYYQDPKNLNSYKQISENLLSNDYEKTNLEKQILETNPIKIANCEPEEEKNTEQEKIIKNDTKSSKKTNTEKKEEVQQFSIKNCLIPDIISRINSSKIITKTSLENDVKKNYSLSFEKEFDYIDVKELKEKWIQKIKKENIEMSTTQKNNVDKINKDIIANNDMKMKNFNSMDLQKKEQIENASIPSFKNLSESDPKSKTLFDKEELLTIFNSPAPIIEIKEQDHQQQIQNTTPKINNDLKNIKDLYEENQKNIKISKNNNNSKDNRGEANSLRGFESFEYKSNDCLRSFSLKTLDYDHVKMGESKSSFFQKNKGDQKNLDKSINRNDPNENKNEETNKDSEKSSLTGVKNSEMSKEVNNFNLQNESIHIQNESGNNKFRHLLLNFQVFFF